MATKKDYSEERTTAASYIITFFQEVGNLTNQFAAYQNTMLELKQSYGNDEEAMIKADDEEKNNLRTSVQNLRFYGLKSYTMYEAIMNSIKKDVDNKTKELYKDIKTNFIIPLDKAEEYVKVMNRVLANEIMKGLLETSQNVLDNIYSEK